MNSNENAKTFQKIHSENGGGGGGVLYSGGEGLIDKIRYC